MEVRILRYWLLIVLVAIAAVGCTSPVRLKHVDGREAVCGPYYSLGIYYFGATSRERGCVRDFQRQGFERTP